MEFSRDVLRLDPEAITRELSENLRRDVRKTLRRAGAVVGISGGVDSSVVLALSVLALGPERVLGVMLPERESDPQSIVRARLVAELCGVETVVEDVTEALTALGCYERRDAAIRRVFPDYGPGYLAKMTLPGSVLDTDTLNVFHLSVIKPDGEDRSKRLDLDEYLQIVAASNLKQRTRMAMLYHHAESRNFAVIGTPNKNEHEQGFFVRWGDGGYDVAPIRHLYKTQVYQLGEHLGIPEEIREATPTSDTYSAPVSQEEFFFRMPFETMDLLWYAADHGVPVSESAHVLDLDEQQVRRAYDDLDRKRRATEYLRSLPIAYSGT